MDTRELLREVAARAMYDADGYTDWHFEKEQRRLHYLDLANAALDALLAVRGSTPCPRSGSDIR